MFFHVDEKHCQWFWTAFLCEIEDICKGRELPKAPVIKPRVFPGFCEEYKPT